MQRTATAYIPNSAGPAAISCKVNKVHRSAAAPVQQPDLYLSALTLRGAAPAQACGIVHLYTCIYWRVKVESNDEESLEAFLLARQTGEDVSPPPPPAHSDNTRRLYFPPQFPAMRIPLQVSKWRKPTKGKSEESAIAYSDAAPIRSKAVDQPQAVALSNLRGAGQVTARLSVTTHIRPADPRDRPSRDRPFHEDKG